MKYISLHLNWTDHLFTADRMKESESRLKLLISSQLSNCRDNHDNHNRRRWEIALTGLKVGWAECVLKRTSPVPQAKKAGMKVQYPKSQKTVDVKSSPTPIYLRLH